MSILTDNLRFLATKHDGEPDISRVSSSSLVEAADEIDRLNDLNERLREHSRLAENKLLRQIDELRAENERLRTEGADNLRAENNTLKDAYLRRCAEYDTLKDAYSRLDEHLVATTVKWVNAEQSNALLRGDIERLRAEEAKR